MTLKGFVRDGRIETDAAIDFPNGTEVSIEFPNDRKKEEGEESSEEIEAWLKEFDSFEPVVWTDAEWNEWQRARAEDRKLELEQWDMRSKQIERLFE